MLQSSNINQHTEARRTKNAESIWPQITGAVQTLEMLLQYIETVS